MQQSTPAAAVSPATRFLATLLVALMLIAPNLHVCEMGGRRCETEGMSCHNPHAAAPNQTIVTATPTPFTVICLAKLPMAMHAALPAPALRVSMPARIGTRGARATPVSSSI